MSSPQKRKAAGVQDAIRQVLLKYWDPIGISDAPQAQDEYDSYIGSVYHLLKGSPTDSRLIEYLRRTETTTMGLSVSSTIDQLEIVAAKLREIHLEV